MQNDKTAPLKPGAIERVLATDQVTPATRRAIAARLAGPGGGAPQCFDALSFATLAAICDRLIPQDDDARRIDLAAGLDAKLAQGIGDGWRYDALPADKEAMTRGVAGVDETARNQFGSGFIHLQPADQDAVLKAVQQGSAKGEIWATLPSPRFFEELLSQVTELYYSHPFAQERIGYIGMADAEGFHALDLNTRDPVEQEASLAPL